MTGLLSRVADPTVYSKGQHLTWPWVLMFAYGAGWTFSVNVIGSLYVAEILALFAIPFVAVKQVFGRYTLLRNVFVAYALIFAGLIVADVVNQTPLEQGLKGWATPVFGAVSLIFVVALLDRNPRAIYGYLLGAALFNFVFGAASYRHYGLEDELAWAAVQDDTNYFKVRFVPFLLPLLILLIQFIYSRSRLSAFALAVSASVVFMFLDARSASLSLFVVALVIALIRRLQKTRITRHLLPIAAVGLLVGYLGYVTFISYVLTESASGQTARQIARTENPYNPLELLAVGRSEWLVAQDVISERPIFGYGSWAYDNDGKFTYLRAEMSNGIDTYFTESATRLNLIPTHSVFLTSWIWGGLIGFMGAILLALVIVRVVPGVLGSGMPLMVIGAFFAFATAWDFLFSPFQILRLTLAHQLGFLIVVATQATHLGYSQK